jgi:signal peptidase
LKYLKYLFNTIILTTAGIAGLFAAGHFGVIDFYRPFIVLSGSMEPAIKTGSVVLVKATPQYQLSDVITFKQGKKFVTHRISSVGLQDFTTKGDANKVNDSNPVTKDQIQGRVVTSIPYLGYAAQRAQTPIGFIALVIIPATIIVYEELKTLKKELLTSIKRLTSRFTSQRSYCSNKSENFKPNTNSYRLSASNTKNHFSPPFFRFKTPCTQTPLQIVNSFYSKPALALNKAFVIPFVGTALTVSIISSAYFLDTEASSGNVLGAADNFGEQIAQVWVSNGYDCSKGAADNQLQRGILISKQVDDQVILTVQVNGADPNKSYDLWVNQDLGACPLGSATQVDFLTTDTQGNGNATYETTAYPGASVLWISLSGGSEVLRSSTVNFN